MRSICDLRVHQQHLCLRVCDKARCNVLIICWTCVALAWSSGLRRRNLAMVANVLTTRCVRCRSEQERGNNKQSTGMSSIQDMQNAAVLQPSHLLGATAEPSRPHTPRQHRHPMGSPKLLRITSNGRSTGLPCTCMAVSMPHKGNTLDSAQRLQRWMPGQGSNSCQHKHSACNPHACTAWHATQCVHAQQPCGSITSAPCAPEGMHTGQHASS